MQVQRFGWLNEQHYRQYHAVQGSHRSWLARGGEVRTLQGGLDAIGEIWLTLRDEALIGLR